MNKKREMKQYLAGVIRGLDRKIWDIDIAIEGRKQIREGVRIEYDRKKEMVDAANLRIAEEKRKEKMDMGIIQKLAGLIAQHTPEIKSLAGQITAVEWDIDHQPVKMNASQLRQIIEKTKDLEKEVQEKVFKSIDIIENQDKGGLKQRKEATIEYQRFIQGMLKRL